MSIQVYNPAIRRKEMDAVLTCLVSEHIGPGQINKNLLEKISIHLPNAGGLCFREPQRALEITLKTLFPEPIQNVETLEYEKPRIIISALAPAYYYDAIQFLGFEPVIIDVDITTGTMQLEKIEENKSSCHALLLDYPIGNFPDFEFFNELKLPIIEDISLSIGTVAGSNSAGTLGTYLFVALEDNHLITAGGGAIVLARTKDYYKKLYKTTQLLNNGILLPDMNAALALVQTNTLANRLEKRFNYFTLFMAQLQRGGHKSLSYNGGLESFLHSFPVVIDAGMEQVIQYANKKKIETVLAFNSVILDRLPEGCPDYPNALSLKLRTLLFPLHEMLGSENAQLVSKVLLSMP